MGFSTSGSLLVIFVGLFIALGSMYTATSNTLGQVTDAYETQHQQHDLVVETGIAVTDASFEVDRLTVNATNTGSTALSVEDTDVLVDGQYVSLSEFAVTVDGDRTGVWAPGQQLVLEIDDEPAERVKLVTEVGVADTREVTS